MQGSLPILIGIGIAILVLIVRLRGSDPRRDSLMGPPRSFRPPSTAGRPPVPPLPPLPPEKIAEVRQLVQAGRLIDAVKVIRGHGGIGLKEAKDILDRLAK